MSDSDSGFENENLTLKEIERRRKKNKKKKEAKKNNRKLNKLIQANIIDIIDLDVNDEEDSVQVDNDLFNYNNKNQSEQIDEKKIEIEEIKDENLLNDNNNKIDLIDVDIEYVSEKPKIDENDPNYGYFTKVFETFKIKTEEELKNEIYTKNFVSHEIEDTVNKAAISEQILQDEINQRRKEAEERGEAQKMSRRKLRLSLQPSIALLKASTNRPDIVEWADVTSNDPFLLVELKAYRNTVSVPRHWNSKRKYLAGKRGFERPPFDLPDYIKRTGIMEMRETMWEKEDSQSLKSKMRERVRPKMGRLDIDYQKLHDAFFKWQTKPQMTKMGELYYEGKEQEAQMREKKPGQLTDDLRIALGMPVGPNCNKFPPPWLIAMQRYGPPPSYPNLKIPGLNAPIPEGCAFGYHAGGWGKPPVDEYGKPLYGDVFGVETPQVSETEDESRIERRHWGEIGSDEEDSDMESDGFDENGTDEAQPSDSGFATPTTTEGFATPSGITTIPGAETPESIELRKHKGVDESVAGGDTPALYSILPEKKIERFTGQIMGSTHVYDLSRKIAIPNDGVEVSLNPDELDISDQRSLERKYEEQLRKQNRNRMDNEEDLSDMVAEQNAKINRKRKAVDHKKSTNSGTQSSQKKHKDFKF